MLLHKPFFLIYSFFHSTIGYLILIHLSFNYDYRWKLGWWYMRILTVCSAYYNETILVCYYLFIYLFIYLFLAVLGLRFCAWVVAASGDHSSSRCAGLSLSRPLLLGSTGSRRAGSVVVAHGPSCSTVCGIFPDQGSIPCPLHWQADSQPLRHQGSPNVLFL